MRRLITPCLLFSFILSLSVNAQAGDKTKVPEVNPLGWFSKNHLEKQVARIDDLARRELGAQVRGNKTDLELLQRIINKGLIPKDERLMLQAMGAVLGNVLQQELSLEWMEYEDRLGKNRALCVKGTMHCLFPITMLSRRMEVGLLPNVQELFDYCVELMAPYIPTDGYGNRL